MVEKCILVEMRRGRRFDIVDSCDEKMDWSVDLDEDCCAGMNDSDIFGRLSLLYTREVNYPYLTDLAGRYPSLSVVLLKL